MRTRTVAVAVLAAWAAVGCSSPPAGSGSGTAPASRPAAGKVELTPVSVAGFEKAVEEQRGKVVLVDVWFLGCGPCRKKFPKIVELHEKYAAEGLAVMSLDIYPEDWAEKAEVVKFLEEKGATFPNFIVQDGDKALEAWQARNDAEFTPAVLLYGRNGGRLPVKTTAPLDEVEAALGNALARP